MTQSDWNCAEKKQVVDFVEKLKMALVKQQKCTICLVRQQVVIYVS